MPIRSIIINQSWHNLNSVSFCRFSHTQICWCSIARHSDTDLQRPTGLSKRQTPHPDSALVCRHHRFDVELLCLPSHAIGRCICHYILHACVCRHFCAAILEGTLRPVQRLHGDINAHRCGANHTSVLDIRQQCAEPKRWPNQRGR